MDSALDHSALILAYGAAQYNPGLQHPAAPFHGHVSTYLQHTIQTGQLPQPQSPPCTYGAHYQPNQWHGYPPCRDYRYSYGQSYMSPTQATPAHTIFSPILQHPYNSVLPDLSSFTTTSTAVYPRPNHGPMSTRDEGGKGICIISFDSGGPGTYSQLLILKEYMSRLANGLGVGEEYVYPADHFDLMGGTGFGGLVAVMLGHLKMNVDQAIDALITVANMIFPDGSQDVPDPESNSKNLKRAIEVMLQTKEITVNAKMHERDRPQKRCKVAIYAAASANINHPQAFRSYSARGSSLNPTIVEAVCATMAAPPLFLPVKIGPRLRQQPFIGGALGANNPTREILKEASAIFGPDRRVAQVLSIGSGLPRVISMESPASDEGICRLLKEIATDCEMVAQDLSTRLYTIDAYLRLNVDRGMELVTMTDWNELGLIEAHTAAYIATSTVSGALDISIRHLKERTGALTLGQINQSSSVKIAAKTAPAVQRPLSTPQGLPIVYTAELITRRPEESQTHVLPTEAGHFKGTVILRERLLGFEEGDAKTEGPAEPPSDLEYTFQEPSPQGHSALS